MKWKTRFRKEALMKYYEHNITTDLEKNISNINRKDIFLFVNKLHEARSLVMKMFCDMFVKDRLAKGLYNEILNKKSRVPVVISFFLLKNKVISWGDCGILIEEGKLPKTIKEVSDILNRFTGILDSEVNEIDNFDIDIFFENNFASITTKDEFDNFHNSLKKGFSSILPLEIYYDYKLNNFSLLSVPGQTIAIKSVPLIESFDSLDISLPTLNLVQDFDKLDLFQRERRDLSDLDFTLTQIDQIENSNLDDTLFVKKFGMVFAGALPLMILKQDDLDKLSIFKELNGVDSFNEIIRGISSSIN